MFHQRHQIYVERRGWKALKSVNGEERDQFDRPDTIYLLAIDEEDDILAGLRLLPTTGPHLLADLFPHLVMSGDIPRGEDILELTRFYVAPFGASRQVRDWLVGVLCTGMLEYCLDHGVRRITSVIDTFLLKLMLSMEWKVRPLGLPQRYPEGMAVRRRRRSNRKRARLDAADQARRGAGIAPGDRPPLAHPGQCPAEWSCRCPDRPAAGQRHRHFTRGADAAMTVAAGTEALPRRSGLASDAASWDTPASREIDSRGEGPDMHPVMRQETARLRLAELFAHPSTVWAVHYSCQSFYQGERLGFAADHFDRGTQPRLRSNPLVLVPSGDRAEAAGAGAGTGVLDELERELLDGYFEFLRANRNMRFLHWHMRDTNFGFTAIEHRYRVLGGEPVSLHDANTYDLARILPDRYGPDYAPPPRLLSLAERNGFSSAGFLNGNEEAAAFENGRYFAVLQSNLRKVAVITEVAAAANANALKTDASVWAQHRGHLSALAQTVWGNPLVRIAGVVFSGISAGLYLGNMLGVF